MTWQQLVVCELHMCQHVFILNVPRIYTIGFVHRLDNIEPTHLAMVMNFYGFILDVALQIQKLAKTSMFIGFIQGGGSLHGLTQNSWYNSHHGLFSSLTAIVKTNTLSLKQLHIV